MFNCKRCKSNVNDSYRYCHGCGAYIGEPVVKGDEWQQNNIEENEIIHEHDEEGKLIILHCGQCDEIVDKSHKFCNKCGKSLEGNLRTELIDDKIIDEVVAEGITEETPATRLSRYNRKIISIVGKLFKNRRISVAIGLILIFAIAGAYYIKQNSKPEPKYEQDALSKSFALDKDWVYYSYFQNTKVKELEAKRGVYKIKAEGNDIVKVSDKPAVFMNLYKNYIYYVNIDDKKIYRMKKDGSGNKKISDMKATGLIVDKGYIYYRSVDEANQNGALFRMKLDGSKNKQLSTDILSYNVIGDYIYYSSKTYLGDVYRIKTDGSEKTKVCKISGPLKYIKDGYIYYSVSNENPRDVFDFMYSSSHLNRVKLDGTNTTILTEYACFGFFIHDNNIYYQQDTPEDVNSTSTLYKMSLEGKEKAKIASDVPPYFYIANDKVYYINIENVFPYKKDFRGDKSLNLLGFNEEQVENYKIEIIKQQTMRFQSLENFNNTIDSGDTTIVYKNNSDSKAKALEVYNTRMLDTFVGNINTKNHIIINLTNFTKDNSNYKFESLNQLRYDGKRIMYITYKKDGEEYKVDKLFIFENMIKKEEGDTVTYYLIEKRSDPVEKYFQLLTFDKKDVKR